MASFLSLTYVDDYGRTTKRIVEIESQALLTDYETKAAAFVTAVTPMTDLGLVRVDLVLQAIATGFSVSADANVDVGATFSGILAAANGKKASHKLPGIKDALVSADGSIDIANVTVKAYIDQFLTAGDFMLSDGQTIDTWLRGSLDR